MAQPPKQVQVHVDGEGESLCSPPQQSGQTWPRTEVLGPPLRERPAPCRRSMTRHPQESIRKGHLFPFSPASLPFPLHFLPVHVFSSGTSQIGTGEPCLMGAGCPAVVVASTFWLGLNLFLGHTKMKR